MSPAHRQPPKTLRRRLLGWTLAPPAAALLALCGCGDGGGAPQTIALSVEIGETVSSDELVDRESALTPWGDARDGRPSPAYVPPHREPPAPQPVGFGPQADAYDQPTALRLPPAGYENEPTASMPTTANGWTAAADQEGAGGENWDDGAWGEDSWNDDAWSEWPEDANPPAAPTPIATPAAAPAAGPSLFASPVAKPSTVSSAAPTPPPAAATDEADARPVEPAPVLPVITDPLAFDTLRTESPAVSEIGRLMIAPVRDGFALGRSGAVFAARAKFEGVLREIASTKDAAAGSDTHLRALADGLRALEEAEHFLPQGDAIDEGLDPAAIARGHRTPVLREGAGAGLLPQQAIARYHLHAAARLADAVAGEQSGSMALFGLGKSYARLATTSEDRLAARRSLVMYRAAILAHDGNHMAANELGVGLARVGHFEAAGRALHRAAVKGGGSTVYRNLAKVEQRLNRPRHALAASQHAERLAARERASGEFSRQLGVQWMTPAQFNRTAGDAPTPPAGAAPAVVAQQPGQQPAQRPWRLGSAFGFGADEPARPPAGNPVAPAVKSQTILR